MEEEVEGELDPWLGNDKLYHVIMCLSLTFLFYALASLTPYRRYAISIGSMFSLLAGAAKELADQFGYFHSSGASLRDAVADILGVCIASIALFLFRSKFNFHTPTPPPPPPPPHLRAISIV